ncbi:MAG: hypothetical protein KDD04_03710 [Sinomicrobium sp.]|nr:hypothetical protein [Sinomicrobium sp.]
MAVEIKEIIIRAIVEEKANAPSDRNTYETLLQHSAEQVLSIIEKNKER